VWKIQSMLLEIIMRLGSIAGAEGAVRRRTTRRASSCRSSGSIPIGRSRSRRARWRISSPASRKIGSRSCRRSGPTEKTLNVHRRRQVFRTITLTPDLWDGAVRVRPDLENARLEAPEAKEQRAMAKFTAGVFGPPGTPEAAAKFAAYAKTAGLDAITNGPRRRRRHDPTPDVAARAGRTRKAIAARGVVRLQRVAQGHARALGVARVPAVRRQRQAELPQFFALVQHAQQAVR
jgi:hypothetical protein